MNDPTGEGEAPSRAESSDAESSGAGEATEHGLPRAPGARIGPFPDCSEFACRDAVVKTAEAVLRDALPKCLMSFVVATYPCEKQGHGFHVTAGCLAKNAVDGSHVLVLSSRLHELADALVAEYLPVTGEYLTVAWPLGETS